MSVKAAGVGHFTIPTAPAAGTSCTSGAANAFSAAYVQLIASTASALYITGIYVEEAAATAGTYIVVQLATGAAAAETVVGQYLIAPQTGSTVTRSYRPIFPPIPVATATRIACKTADSVGAQAKLITLECIAQSNVVDDGITVGTVNLVNTTTTVTNQLTAAAIATAIWQDATAADFTTASSIGKALYIANVAPGASGGHLISGANAGTTTFGAFTITGATTATGGITGNITGNLSGSVGSVTGAVGSVTGAVGSVTAAVTTGAISNNAITAAAIAADAITAAKIADGAIDAATFAPGAINAAAIAADAITDAKVAADVTIASVTGAVGSVTGAVGSVTGAVGSVTGAVGSVTGNVGGSVASVTAAVTVTGDLSAAMKASVTAAVPTAAQIRAEMDANSTDLDSIGVLATNIFARTDVATSSRAAPGDAMGLTAATIDSIWDEVIESGLTGRQLQRLFASALLGKVSGMDTLSPVFRDVGDTKARITATVDADGNRSAVVLDGT